MAGINQTNEPNLSPVARFFGDLVKLLPSLALTGVIAVTTFWRNSHEGQKDLIHRVELLEKGREVNAANIAENTKILQANAVKLAEMGILEQNMAMELKELKEDLREIKATVQR